MMELAGRRLAHLFKSGCLAMGIDHFLVMFPSALLVAKLSSVSLSEPVISLSTILFMSGAGTLLFLAVTKGRIPFFLGPSFAYIGLTSYLIMTMTETGTLEDTRSFIQWGYMFSGILLLVIAFLYRSGKTKRVIHFLFPDVIMGPAISLIGLELASLAVEDAGISSGNTTEILIALITLGTIILAALLKRRFLKNASILIGVLVGCVAAVLMGIFDIGNVWQTQGVLSPPQLHVVFERVPDNLGGLFFLIIPPTIVAFMESIGRITVLEGMFEREAPVEGRVHSVFFKALGGHAVSHLFSVMLGSAPNAIYAENLAIMNINSLNKSSRKMKQKDRDVVVRHSYDCYSIYPYMMAAVISIIVACLKPVQQFFSIMPKAVIGGMELFIFGLIAAPGIQILVEKKIDYKKISNQIITASVLLAGISDITVKLSTVELKGMSLGLTIGVILNLLVKFLSACGILNEQLSLFEVMAICLERFPGEVLLSIENSSRNSRDERFYTPDDMKRVIRQDDTYKLIKEADKFELREIGSEKKISIRSQDDQIIVELEVPVERKAEIYNDYDKLILSGDGSKLRIRINSEVSPRVLRRIVLRAAVN